MRRIFASFTSAALLTAALGCHHIAGRCDCGNGGCCNGSGLAPAAVHPEPIKVMPKSGEKAPPPGRE